MLKTFAKTPIGRTLSNPMFSVIGDNNTDYENIINGITLDDMKKFTKKLFNGKNIIEVTMTRSCRRRNKIKTRMSKLK